MTACPTIIFLDVFLVFPDAKRVITEDAETGEQDEWTMTSTGSWQRPNRTRKRGGKRRLEHDLRHYEIHGNRGPENDGDDSAECPSFPIA